MLIPQRVCGGAKIEVVITSLLELIPILNDINDINSCATIKLNVMKVFNSVRWIYKSMQVVSSFVWNDIHADEIKNFGV